jgi:hypothetical protein
MPNSEEASTMAILMLRDELTGLRGDIAKYGLAEKRARRNLRILAVSVAFDILLSVGLYVGYRKADDASRAATVAAAKATAASSTTKIACQARNASNEIQAKLWNTVLRFPAPAVETAAAKADRERRTAEFKRYIDDAFAIKDCSKE